MASIFVVALLALPVWNWLSKKWDKRWAYIGGIAFWASVQILIMTLGPGTPLALLLILCGLAGIGVSAAHVLPWAIFPDAIEWDELSTGERHEGMYYSLITLSHKIASSISIPLALLLLELSGYRANAALQSPRTVLVIRLLMGPIPAVFLCLGIVLAFFYPLNRARYREIAQKLEQRRGQ